MQLQHQLPLGAHPVAPAREQPPVAAGPRPGLLQAALMPVLIGLVGLVALVYAVLGTFNYNPSGLIFIGDHWRGAQRFWTESILVQPGFGYDGQFFFYVAHDPLLRSADAAAYFDHPAYRYSRILYPSLAWLAALGRPEALPWAMLGVNLLAALVGTLLAVDVVRSLGKKPLLALGFAFSPAIIFGVMADLAEPTSLALVAAGLALHLRARHGAAGLALGIGCLAREVTALVSIGFALNAASRRAWRVAAAYLAPLAIPLAWHLLVWVRFGALPALDGPRNFGLPFSGAIYRAGVLLGVTEPLLNVPVPSNPWSELMIVAVSVGVIVLGLLTIVRRRDAFAIQLGLQAAAAMCTTPVVWIGLGSYARVFGLLFLFYGLVLITRPQVITPSAKPLQ